MMVRQRSENSGDQLEHLVEIQIIQGIRQPLVMDTSVVFPDSVAVMLLLSNMEFIHHTMVDSTPCPSAASVITANEVLSNR
jgi:hypothetical protein